MTSDLWVFVGPSLPQSRVRELCPHAIVRPPAAQGDVWRALNEGPRVVALIDGVFEASPAIWHHELLAALRSGVAVFGGASMGALRAAELQGFGMIGVGVIFRAYRDGELVDDAEVAVLHADEDSEYRTMSLPLVNVRFAAAEAVRAKILTRSQALELVEAAVGTFYQDRHWRPLFERVARTWGAQTSDRFARWSRSQALDLKARDAEETLLAAAELAKAKVTLPRVAERGSSLVRRRRLSSSHGRQSVHGEGFGIRQSLLAGWARSMGVRPDPARVHTARKAWQAAASQRGMSAEEWNRVCGFAPDQVERHLEDIALDDWMLEHAARWLQDGPSAVDGVAAETFRRSAAKKSKPLRLRHRR